MPTKNASRDMNSADNPRNETTRLSALATGFRLRTTAAPKITVSTAKIQKRKGDIAIGVMKSWSDGVMDSCVLPTLHYSNTLSLQCSSFLLVPFQHHAMHYSADIEQFFLVMHHVGSREAGDSVIFAQKNRLLRTNFLAHPA